MIHYGKQSISDEDITAVVTALRSDYLTTGPQVEAFESEFAKFVGAKHAVAVCNATAALHLAMLVAEIGPGDRVVTSPNTFVSSANCAAFVGATPDFSDIDSETYNLCPEALKLGWKPDTKAVVAVAYAGQSADMPAIAEVARSKGAVVIEDGCHGVGGGFVHEGHAYKIGGHPWADMTTFSFHPVKTMTTGEGGMLVTDNDEYAARARALRSHGITRDPAEFSNPGENATILNERGSWYYEMQALGYNYRITDIQCALGRSQLRKLPDFISRRLQILARYNKAFAELSWLSRPALHLEDSRELISWHLYSVEIDFKALGKHRSDVMKELRDQGVGTQVLYIPVYLQPWYRKRYGYSVGKCPNSELYYENALSLPLYPEMTDADVDTVIRCVKELA
jgi:UDP-4-amino-4,6-dideoxy-N-acetyl-beta-L-altrosamine transaminase